jgi:Asp-tRNA(Asn)/Glu-tRNA(Gln) amidotransferase A subunit family amidase
VHPLLNGWLDKLEAYRVSQTGFAGYWADLDLDRYRAGMFTFLQRYDVILCPVYTQPALPHGTSILEENFRGFSHTMAYNLAGWPAADDRRTDCQSQFTWPLVRIGKTWP